MQLAGPWAVNAPPDRASATGVLRAAVSAGIDHIDTAQYYGPDVVNDLIREALHPYPRELAIVSKVAVLPASDPYQLRQGIQDNLRTLRVAQLAATCGKTWPPRTSPSITRRCGNSTASAPEPIPAPANHQKQVMAGHLDGP
jgi:diketogulonate reductase-like aldo/keto reductase